MQDLRTTAPALRPLRRGGAVPPDRPRFAETEVRPHVHDMDEAGTVPARPHREVLRARPHGDRGPRSVGGAGGSSSWPLLAIEELARVDASAAIYVDVHNTLVNNALLRWGNAEQKARYFPRLTSDLLGAFALSEPATAAMPSRWSPGPSKGRRLGAHRAASSGSPTAPRPGSSSSSPTPTFQGLQGNHRRSWSSATSPASTSARRRTSSASAPPARRS